MKRHPFNVFSLVLGVLLAVLAIWIVFPGRGWLFGVPDWFLPVAVILVGAALMSPLFTSRADDGSDSEESGAADRPVETVEARLGEESTRGRTTDDRESDSADLTTEA